MAGTVTMGGLGSGIDVEGLIEGLVKANQVTLNKLQTQASSYRTASSTLSDIGTALSSLQSAANALSSATGVGGLTATSSHASIVASANGEALPALYKVEVEDLATEQRTYTKSFDSNSGALGQSGSFTMQVGSGTAKTIAVAATDSLDTIAGKINQLGIRASASVFYDGSKYRLQIRGLDTGAANALTFGETGGTALDLNGDGSSPTGGKTVQGAQDAKLTIDGFQVTRATNQITGVIPGVTLALTAETTSPVTLTVASDGAALEKKISTLVSAYNAVIKASQAAAGFGQQRAKLQTLAGDSAIRSVTQRLSAAATKREGTGPYKNLADLGIMLDSKGMLSLDSTKLSKALSADSGSVVKLLARPVGASSGGLMNNLVEVVTDITNPAKGVLAVRQQSFTNQARKLDDRALQEQDRVAQYADRLRKSLADMDAKMGADKVMAQAVANMAAVFNNSR
jgi:flagellar hook-associated protein 2